MCYRMQSVWGIQQGLKFGLADLINEIQRNQCGAFDGRDGQTKERQFWIGQSWKGSGGSLEPAGRDLLGNEKRKGNLQSGSVAVAVPQRLREGGRFIRLARVTCGPLLPNRMC